MKPVTLQHKISGAKGGAGHLRRLRIHERLSPCNLPSLHQGQGQHWRRACSLGKGQCHVRLEQQHQRVWLEVGGRQRLAQMRQSVHELPLQGLHHRKCPEHAADILQEAMYNELRTQKEACALQVT